MALWLEFICLPEINLSQRIGTRSIAVASGFINPFVAGRGVLEWEFQQIITMKDEEEHNLSWHLI